VGLLAQVSEFEILRSMDIRRSVRREVLAVEAGETLGKVEAPGRAGADGNRNMEWGYENPIDPVIFSAGLTCARARPQES